MTAFGCARALGVSLLALGATAPAFAQTAPASVAADPNVTPYAPAFFAEYRPITALDMIGRIPGFQFDGGTSARGFAGTAGNVLIDGERPPTRSDALANVLSRIPASQVLRIDIVRNGAGGVDMQGKPVVANVIRKPDAGLTGSVSTGLNITNLGRLQPNFTVQAQRQHDGRSMDGSFRLSGGQLDADGYRERRAPDGRIILWAKGDGDIDFSSGEVTGVYEGPLGGGRVRANLLINYNGSLYDGLDVLLIPTGSEHSVSDAARWRGEAGLRWNRSLPAGMGLELVGFHSVTDEDNDGLYDTPAFTSGTLTDRLSEESIASFALKFAALRTAWGPIAFETGSEVALNTVETATDYVFNGNPLLLPGDDTTVEELRTESFVTGVWTPRSNLSIESALRYETSRISAGGTAGDAETNLDYLKPRLNLTWTPRPRETINLKLEKNVEQLSFSAFTASASFATAIFGRGNPDIRPQQVWLASARYEKLFDRQGSFIVEFTHEAFEDLLGAVVVFEIPPGGTTPRPFNVIRNVGDATRDRITVSSRQPLDRFGLTGGLLSGQIYYRWSSTEDPVTFQERRLSGEQAVGWALALSQNLVAQRVTWSVSASSGLDQRSYAPSTLSDFETQPNLQASINYRPDARLSLTAGLVFGSDTTSDFTLFNAPRNVGVPVYTERSVDRGNSQVFFSARRSF